MQGRRSCGEEGLSEVSRIVVCARGLRCLSSSHHAWVHAWGVRLSVTLRVGSFVGLCAGVLGLGCG